MFPHTGPHSLSLSLSLAFILSHQSFTPEIFVVEGVTNSQYVISYHLKEGYQSDRVYYFDDIIRIGKFLYTTISLRNLSRNKISSPQDYEGSFSRGVVSTQRRTIKINHSIFWGRSPALHFRQRASRTTSFFVGTLNYTILDVVELF